jgi:hypothetical protein
VVVAFGVVTVVTAVYAQQQALLPPAATVTSEALHIQNLQNLVTLDSNHEYNISPYCEVFRDGSGSMRFEEVLQAARQGVFKAEGSSLIRVRGKEALWLRFTVRNTKLIDWVLLAGNMRIDSMTLYTPTVAAPSDASSAADTLDTLAAHEYLVSYSGELTTLRSRAIPTKFVAFPLALADDNAYTFYARVKALYTPAVPVFRLVAAETFMADVQLWDILAWVLLGMLLFALVFNLVPLFIVKDGVYLWYVIHILSLIFATMSSSTLLAERFVTPETKPLVNSAVQLLNYAVFVQFIRVFFAVRTSMPAIYNRLALMSVIAIVMPIFLIALGGSHVYTYWRVPILLGSAVVISAILLRAIWFVPVLTARLYGVVMLWYLLLKMGLFAFGVLHEPLITSGAGVVETILFSFALAARLTQMREQIVKEREERALAEELQREERRRNTELALANEEIRRQNSLLEEQSREIELTNTQLREANIELDTALHDLKETQTQLVASERLGAVGLLTAGVMHEINNPNAAVVAALDDASTTVREIKTYFFSLLDDVSAHTPAAQKFAAMSDDAAETLAVASNGAERIARIVGNLQNFTKHQRAGVYQRRLHEELKETVEMLKYQFKKVVVELDVNDDLVVEGNFGELNQVFLNMLVNAAQADASHITIQAEIQANRHSNAQTGEQSSHIMIGITDNGVGMSEEVRSKLFEPFYSTKGVGNSGLGLSISKQIVERHGGRLWCESKQGEGTAFLIVLPLKQPSS